MEDLLRSFRRASTQRRAESVPGRSNSTERETYMAFSVKARTARVDIRTKSGSAHAVNYSYIIDVMYEAQDGTDIVLILSYLIVRLAGRHLVPLADALRQHVCDRLTEFDPDRYAPPADEVPVVESIEIKVRRA